MAAVFVWADATSDTQKLLVASLTFAVTLGVTATSVVYSEFYHRPLSPTFYYLQSVFDLLLVTAVVHVTGASISPFAALYILVIASASLLLPVGGGLLIAALGNVLYVADAFWSPGAQFTASIWLQLSVFAIVALGSAWLSAKLQEAGAGTEAELAQVRLQAADILHNIRSGIITVDAAGRLIYANPTAQDLLGVDLTPLIGRPVLDRIHERAPELADAVRRSLLKRERTTRAEGNIAAGNRQFPIGVTTTYTDGDGRLTDRTATAIFQDISDQKRMESLRLRAERLEGIAELSASLAHEIKNPLASIRSAVEQLSRSQFAGEDEQVLGRLVMRESDRLSRLLSEFLDFARVRVARREALDVAVLAEHAIRLARAHPDCPEGVEFVCEAERNRFVVDGDEDLLHRALFNLLLNALQASPDGGSVAVEVSAVSYDQLGLGLGSAPAPARDAVAISVSDGGPGIPLEIRDRLFDPFFTTKPGGTGLGLAVVHRAIDAHSGLVFLDSGPAGTRFTVVLPTALRPAPDALGALSPATVST